MDSIYSISCPRATAINHAPTIMDRATHTHCNIIYQVFFNMTQLPRLLIREYFVSTIQTCATTSTSPVSSPTSVSIR